VNEDQAMPSVEATHMAKERPLDTGLAEERAKERPLDEGAAQEKPRVEAAQPAVELALVGRR
jgi:hypothetical protein